MNIEKLLFFVAIASFIGMGLIWLVYALIE